MIRVVYRWRVPEANRVAFRAAWEKATTLIRENTLGARGSVLFESCDDPTEFMTVAHWDHLDQWRAFVETAARAPMKEMHGLGEMVSRQAFRQIGDHTV